MTNIPVKNIVKIKIMGVPPIQPIKIKTKKSIFIFSNIIKHKNNTMKKILLNERFILVLILLNAATILLLGYLPNNKTVNMVDNVITVVFIAELIVKLNKYRSKFPKDGWNIFDGVLIILSIPSLFNTFYDTTTINLSYLLVFRVLRVFKVIRTVKYINGIEHLLNGLKNALKSSMFILLCFAIYVFLIGVLSNNLFGNTTPNLYGTPLRSFYSTFGLFTLEGWQTIPQSILGKSNYSVYFIYPYFTFIVLTGGIFGLSLINSIFVDAMVSDNNDELKNKVDRMEGKIDALLTKNKIN